MRKLASLYLNHKLVELPEISLDQTQSMSQKQLVFISTINLKLKDKKMKKKWKRQKNKSQSKHKLFLLRTELIDLWRKWKFKLLVKSLSN